MITKMKKLTFLVYYKEYEAFLNGVRDLGVVHVAEKQQGVADNTELQDSIRLSARLQATEKLLQAFKPARPAVEETPASAARGLEVLSEVDELQAEKNKLQQQLQTYQKEKAALEPWGNFEPASLSRLHDAGLEVGFYSCSEGNYDATWEDTYNAMVISRQSSRVYFVTVTRNSEETDLDAIAKVVDINAVGFLRIIKELLPLINAQTKIICVTSEAGSIGANHRSQEYSYAMSKCAENMACVILQKYFDEKIPGARVVCLHPGWLKTTMGGGNIAEVNPSDSAKDLMKIASDIDTISRKEMFIDHRRNKMPW